GADSIRNRLSSCRRPKFWAATSGAGTTSAERSATPASALMKVFIMMSSVSGLHGWLIADVSEPRHSPLMALGHQGAGEAGTRGERRERPAHGVSGLVPRRKQGRRRVRSQRHVEGVERDREAQAASLDVRLLARPAGEERVAAELRSHRAERPA